VHTCAIPCQPGDYIEPTMKLVANEPSRRDSRDGFGYSTSNVPKKEKKRKKQQNV